MKQIHDGLKENEIPLHQRHKFNEITKCNCRKCGNNSERSVKCPESDKTKNSKTIHHNV